jgi:transposase-like protein
MAVNAAQSCTSAWHGFVMNYLKLTGVFRSRSEIIELCVRWYLAYRLSYRDLVEMMAERGIAISRYVVVQLRNEQ